MHIEAAIKAGKNLFTEKPVAVDGPGIRKVLAAAEEAKKKSLAVVAGTQRRHQAGYLESMKRIHDGAHRRPRPRPASTGTRGASGCKPRQAELERHGVADPQLVLLHLALRRPHRRAARPQPRRRQLGDRAPPGPGRRHGRPPGAHRAPTYGQSFDHFAVDYEYPERRPRA